MKTLYVSDLDGTLLRSDETTSAYTNETVNTLAARGMLFSYATARSYKTASKVTRGLNAHIPLIVYNGALVIDNKTEEIVLSNFFGSEVKAVIDDLLAHDVWPIVYAFVEGRERYTFLPHKNTPGMQQYTDSRAGDVRETKTADPAALYAGDIFYLTCIDEPEKLEPLYAKYKERYHCVYQTDIYTKTQWLEIMPLEASKSRAIAQLKDKLGCDRLVVFGDGKNDIDMFEIADEGYAVKNAVEELKAVATGVIGGNDEDGVAIWLKQYAQIECE